MTKKQILGLIWDQLAQIWAPKNFLGFLPVLDVKLQCKLSLYPISRKTYDPNSKNWQKI